MWRVLARRRLEESRNNMAPVGEEELRRADSILLAVFARYGDSIITFRVIRDLVRRHPGKRYLLITTPQALPYAEAIVPREIECVGFNKHRSPIRLWRLSRLLRREPFDIGLNPWSHGLESEYFITFARRFHPYRLFASFPRNHNLYERVRGYLSLKGGRGRERPSCGRLPERAGHILISPFSTDVRKGLDRKGLERLIAWLRGLYGDPEITVALFRKEERLKGLRTGRFYFTKTYRGSLAFLRLMEGTDLFVGVDAGPLHLADALGVPALGLFGPTAPETILDRDSTVIPLRSKRMEGWFCDVSCTDPLCLHDLFEGGLEPVPVDFGRPPQLATRICPLKAAGKGV